MQNSRKMRNFVASLKGGKRRPDAVRRNTNTIKKKKGFYYGTESAVSNQPPQEHQRQQSGLRQVLPEGGREGHHHANNPGYGKYYPKAVEKDTITLRGLAKHMAEHQCVYSRDIIEGVLIKMASCMIELIAQGNPVKIDGLGIFWPTVESTKEGITRAAILEGKWNANTYVKGVHIRFRPEGAADDDITSRTFKDQCSLATYGVEEKVDLTPEETDPSKKVYIKKVTPLEDWITEQLAQNP